LKVWRERDSFEKHRGVISCRDTYLQESTMSVTSYPEKHTQAMPKEAAVDSKAATPKAPAPTVALLIDALGEPCAATRAWAAGQLGPLAPNAPAVTEPLLLCATLDSNAAVRQAATKALATIRARPAVPDTGCERLVKMVRVVFGVWTV
jgi:hypothetical protein